MTVFVQKTPKERQQAEWEMLDQNLCSGVKMWLYSFEGRSKFVLLPLDVALRAIAVT